MSMKSCLIPDKPGPSGGTAQSSSDQLRDVRTAWTPRTKWLVKSEWQKQVARPQCSWACPFWSDRVSRGSPPPPSPEHCPAVATCHPAADTPFHASVGGHGSQAPPQRVGTMASALVTCSMCGRLPAGRSVMESRAWLVR